jgi:MraZ protein
MYLLYGDHLKNELHGYTVAEFDKVIGQINKLARGSDAKNRLSRLFIGQSIKLDVDKDGRTVMPIKQRQKLGLKDGELYFSGLGDHFEIWKAETFTEEVGDKMTDWLEGQGDNFDPLSLLDG